MLVSRSFFLKILGSESGRLGFQKQAFGVRGVAKTNFSQKLEFCWFQVHSWINRSHNWASGHPKSRKNKKKRTLKKHHKNNTAESRLLLRFWSKMGLVFRGGSAPKITKIRKTLRSQKRNPILSPWASKIQKSRFWLPKTWKMSCRLLVICNLFVCIACTSQSCEGKPQRAGHVN